MVRLTRFTPRLFVLYALFAACTTVVQAQEVRGRITAADTRGPLIGVFVMLRDSANNRWDAALTDSAGRYRLRTQRPGTYTILAERIGYASSTTPSLQLLADAVVAQDVTLEIQPIVLPPLSAAGQASCRIARERAQEVAAVWNEARKALTVVSWAAEKKLVSYEILHFSRVMDGRGRRVLREYNQEATDRLNTIPWFVSDPDDMINNGFVQGLANGTQFYAPSAEVLLASAFLATHCLSLRSENDRIGIAFQPMKSPAPRDIKGTLWLESRSLALQSVEFEYLYNPGRSGGGTMQYTYLPGGMWVPSGWRITLPLRSRSGGPAQVQQGAHVLRVLASDSTHLWTAGERPASGPAVVVDSAMESMKGTPRLPVHSAAGLVILNCGTPSRDTQTELVVLVVDSAGQPKADVPVTITQPGSTRPVGKYFTSEAGIAVFCRLRIDRSFELRVATDDPNARQVTIRTQRGIIAVRTFQLR